MNLNIISFICKEANKVDKDTVDFIGVSDNIVINNSAQSYFTLALFSSGKVEEELFAHVMLESLNSDGGRYLGNYNLTEGISSEDFKTKNLIIDNRIFTKIDAIFPPNVDKVVFKIYLTSKTNMDNVNRLNPELSEFDKFNKLRESNQLELNSMMMANIIRQ